MRLIEKILGRESPKQEESVGRSGTDILPRESVFSGSPGRVLRTETDVRKDNALLEMSTVVAEIEKDPDTNWTRYKGDFEKAVTGMREAFEPAVTPEQPAGSVPSGSPLAQQLVDLGWKLSARDKLALSAYEDGCKEHSLSPNPWDAGDFMREVRRQDEWDLKERIKRYGPDDSIER